MEPKRILSLSEIRSGQKVRLVSVEAGHGLTHRLISMGLIPNVEITVVKSYNNFLRSTIIFNMTLIGLEFLHIINFFF